MLKKPNRAVANITETSAPSTADAQERIAACALYKAEARGFAPGGEVNDSLLAEVQAISAMPGASV